VHRLVPARLLVRLLAAHCARSVPASVLHKGEKGGERERDAQSRSYCVTEYWCVLRARPSRNSNLVETTCVRQRSYQPRLSSIEARRQEREGERGGEAHLEEVLEHAARGGEGGRSARLGTRRARRAEVDALVALLRVRLDPLERVLDPEPALGLARAGKVGLVLAPERERVQLVPKVVLVVGLQVRHEVVHVHLVRLERAPGREVAARGRTRSSAGSGAPQA